MAAALIIFLGASEVQRITASQDAARRATSECQKRDDKEACQSMLIGIRAVTASEEAVRVSIWQSFFSAAGLAGLGFTVWYARRTWVEAQRSANADSEALEHARRGLEEARRDSVEQDQRFERQIKLSEDTAKRQLRAYISILNSQVENVGPDLTPRFTVKFQNDGQTPAHDLICHSNIAIYPFPLDEEFPPLDFGSESRSREPLGPGVNRTIKQSSLFLSKSAFKGLNDGSWALYCYGEVQYRDIFDERHTTKWRVFMGGKAGMSGELFAYHGGNEAD